MALGVYMWHNSEHAMCRVHACTTLPSAGSSADGGTTQRLTPSPRAAAVSKAVRRRQCAPLALATCH